MRLLKLHLKNYLNIYNALGKYEITIDFSKCKNKITVIRSENGSGKSSIINELHPFFSNSNIWMEDVPIVKIIEFLLDDATILSISYSGWKAKISRSKQSKCYIKRIYPDGNTIELNPNGNISSGKDIISSLLDINDDYIILSSLSANSKGIGGLKPGERKRFLSLVISSLDPYIKLNKEVSQKYTVLKSMIQTINVKISQLGNIEMITANMERNITDLKILEQKKQKLIEDKASLKTNLSILSKDGKPTEKYQNCINKRSILEYDIKNIPNNILNFDENELIELEKNNIQLESKYQVLDDQLKMITEKEKRIRDEITTNNIKLRSLFDQSVFEDTKNRLEKAKVDLEYYTKAFENIGFREYENISEQEYSIAIDAIEKFNQTIINIGNNYSVNIIDEAVNYIYQDYKVIDYESIMNNHYKIKIDEIKNRINQQTDLQNKSKNYDMIPNDCNHIQNCPFIINIVEAKQSMIPVEEYNSILAEFDRLENELDNTNIMMKHQNELLKCISDIKMIYEYINSMKQLILRFPNTEIIDSQSHIIHCIRNSIKINLNLSAYREYTNFITLISTCKKDILSYEEKINTILNSSRESWQLQQLIEIKNNELQETINTKLDLLNQLNEVKNNILQISTRLTELQNSKILKEKYEAISNDLRVINEEINSLQQLSIDYQTMENELIKVSEEENNISLTSIPQLQNEIEQSKYQMVLYDQYRKDYAYYSDMFDKIEMVKQSTSVNGIQSVIMDIRMHDLLQMINQLSAMMFGSRFEFQKFDISPDSFNMPVLDKESGMTRPDISMMSNSQLSQLSMIISFVLLYNASKNYNIIRLDEVDNNLDNDNRFQFFNLINMIMDILHFDQCIIISHNYELDLTNCDLIITRIQNSEVYRSLINSGANIIADFMR